MGYDLYVKGYIPIDDTWKKQLDVWNACKRAGVEVPESVKRFFNYSKDPNDEEGIEVELGECLKSEGWNANAVFTLEVAKIPNNVKFIKFFGGN